MSTYTEFGPYQLCFVRHIPDRFFFGPKVIKLYVIRGQNVLITLYTPPVIQSIVHHRMVGLPYGRKKFWEYVYSFWHNITVTDTRCTDKHHYGIAHACSLAGLQLCGTNINDMQWRRKQHNCSHMSGAIDHVSHYNVYHCMLSFEEHPTVVVLWQYKVSCGMLWQNLSDILISIKYSKHGKKRQHVKELLTKQVYRRRYGSRRLSKSKLH